MTTERAGATITSDGAWTVPFDSRRESHDTSPRQAYANQLLSEGLASLSDGAVIVPWEVLYRLSDDPAHAESLSILGLPDREDWKPVLESHGVPSENNFCIFVKAWHGPGGLVATSTVQRSGAVITRAGQSRWISEPAWRTLIAIERLASEGETWQRNQRLQLIADIRIFASNGGAVLDAFLESTNVIAPTVIDLDLKFGEAVGAPIIEIQPNLPGAPESWLASFDRFHRVQSRYDVPTSDGGITHIIVNESVASVLEPIKALPARRIASDAADAFIHNPYSLLGDNAEQILPADKFEEAKRRSGLSEWEIDALPDGTCWECVLIDVAGICPDECFALDKTEALELLERSAKAQQRALPVVSWRGKRIALCGLTVESLRRISDALVQESVRQNGLSAEDVFSLTNYSDRVAGFDARPVHVPYLKPPGAGQEWIPENISVGVLSVDPKTGKSESRVLALEEVGDLRQSVEQAKKAGEHAVRIPGTVITIPITEAEVWVQQLDSLVRQKPRAPSYQRDPKPVSTRPILRILHNIEQLEYGREAVLPDVIDQPPEIPAAMRCDVTLLDHQVQGLAWLQQRHSHRAIGVSGILLADDMGLGKTIQALMFIAWYRERTPDAKACLVVAPVSLLENWKSEIEKFLDGRQGATLCLYGTELQRFRLREHEIDPELRKVGLRKFLVPGFAKSAGIVLTTYETLRDYEFSMARETWGIVLSDEAQKIKTPSALVTQASKALKAEFKIACTGTPVENSLADLWCLFDYVQPGLLGSLNEFSRKIRRPVELRETGHEDLVERLRGAIDAWVLRRMKTDVAELPPKIDEEHPDGIKVAARLPMSPLQQALYASAVNAFRSALSKDSVADKEPTHILMLLHRLRIICANPLAAESGDWERLAVGEHLKHSPKLAWLIQRLEQITALQEKVIVFTEFRDLQRLIQRAVSSKFGFAPDIVNGDTSVNPELEDSRQALIDGFQQKPGFNVIILSTTAVGFGVNIQAANHVIHFTRPWNPAKEDQATDRAYRIGQTKSVYVYCPTIVGEKFESFEQRVAQRLAHKRQLSKDMLAPIQPLHLSDFSDL